MRRIGLLVCLVPRGDAVVHKLWFDAAWDDYVGIANGELVIASCKGHYEA